MALAELLFGDRCPEGKLPVTFYHADHVLPDFTDYSMKERTYRYMTGEALYPFGYGLSYTTFAYKKATADKDQVTEEGVTIRVSVKNTGARAGAETVQAYVKIHREGPAEGHLQTAALPGGGGRGPDPPSRPGLRPLQPGRKTSAPKRKGKCLHRRTGA